MVFRSSLLLVLGALLGTAKVWCETTVTASTVSSTVSRGSEGGFSLELILTKLQLLEYHVLKNSLEIDRKIANLSSVLGNLEKSVERLSEVAWQTGGTVSQLEDEGKQIAISINNISRDLGDLQAQQRLLLTSQQFEEYIMLRGCNASSPPAIIEDRVSNYTSCRQVPFNVSGVYQVQPEKPFKEPITVLCDQEYDSGGWTVIQHRFNGSVNFYRGWQEYKHGFGNLEGEFWLGLDRIHQLTGSTPHELVVLLEDYDGKSVYAKYDRFEIGDEGQKYNLTKINGYSGTAGDSLGDFAGMKFSTLDSDNDSWSSSCAVTYTGAWWYSACHRSNLNGQYLRGETSEYATGMVWYTFRGYHHSLKTSKMMIRPKV